MLTIILVNLSKDEVKESCNGDIDEIFEKDNAVYISGNESAEAVCFCEDISLKTDSGLIAIKSEVLDNVAVVRTF